MVKQGLSERLASMEPQDIITPSPTVAGPAIEALRFAGHVETLRELYLNLLASAMDARTADKAHPAFVGILKQLSPDEAKALLWMSRTVDMDEPFPVYPTTAVKGGSQVKKRKAFYVWLDRFSAMTFDAGPDVPEQAGTYGDNLIRLGLLEPLDGFETTTDDAYGELEQRPEVTRLAEDIKSEADISAIVERGVMRLTAMGKQFISACVSDRRA